MRTILAWISSLISQVRLSSFRHSKRIPTFVTIFWIGIAIFFWGSRTDWLRLYHLELKTYDLRFHSRGPLPQDDRIILIGIDDSSILGESLDEEELLENPDYAFIKGFPYPRKAYALILEKLFQAGARAVAFDLVLSKDSPLPKAERLADDLTLKEALRKYGARTVLGANFFEIVNDAGNKISPLDQPQTDLLPSESIADNEIVGFVNYKNDEDGFIRKMNPVGWPHIENLPSDEYKPPPYSLDALAVKKAFPEIKLPLQYETQFITFSGPSHLFKVIPLYLLFTKKSWEPQRPPLFGGKIFKNKTCSCVHDISLTINGAKYQIDDEGVLR